ncbi:condensin complex subunit 1, partial [Phenoliferia sp. Uapishka_3]
EEGEEEEGEEEDVGEEEEEEDQEGEEGEDVKPKIRAKKSAAAKPKVTKRKPRKSDGIDLAAADQSQALAGVDQDTLTRMRLTKKYYLDAIAFIQQIEEASKVIIELVASTVKSEVLEAMDFFKVAFEYKIEAAEAGVKRMLHLIWSKDEATTEEDGKEVKGVRSRLIECYSQLYFDPVPDLSEENQNSRVAKNVIELTRDATLAELISLEQLLGVMMAKGVVDDAVISKLWKVYSTSKDIPRFQRRGAIIVLGMFAAPNPTVVSENIELLLKIGLGPHGKADLILAKYTCTALNRISGSVKKVKGSLEDVSVRLAMDSPVFTRLQDAIMHPSRNKEWFSMAEQAVNTIYGLGDQPDALCSDILRQMTARVFGPKAPVEEEAVEGENAEADVQDETASASGREPSATPALAPTHSRSESQTPAPPSTMGNAFELSQLIFVAGHCAIKQLVHLELVERDIKRRKAEESKKAGSKSAAQDELDQVAGSIEDDIGDTIAATKEKELLYGENSLLAIYGPMASTIVSQPKVYRNPMLKTAATLALAKFMCVSAQFCEDNLMMLFKVFETSREEAVRSNIVIALGDIAVCFSNIMDENSDRLYAGLHDKDLTVKKNTLMVLTHLILNGMIKVKGQLGEMAKCLEDEDKRISDLAHLFFTELSTKEKAIYNNLPDIISHLSSGASPVDEATFEKSMKFIFTFVDKKREAESIVEKLCQRFPAATEPRQWRDIAFCLSLLPFNSEVAFKKLVEGLPYYQDKLHEEGVYKRFQEILAKARTNKVNKNDQDIKEFEDALEEHRAKGTEDQELSRKVAKSKKKTKAKAKARPKRKAAAAESGSESE